MNSKNYHFTLHDSHFIMSHALHLTLHTENVKIQDATPLKPQ